MSTFEIITVVISAGMFLLALLSLIIYIVDIITKKR